MVELKKKKYLHSSRFLPLKRGAFLLLCLFLWGMHAQSGDELTPPKQLHVLELTPSELRSAKKELALIYKNSHDAYKPMIQELNNLLNFEHIEDVLLLGESDLSFQLKEVKKSLINLVSSLANDSEIIEQVSRKSQSAAYRNIVRLVERQSISDQLSDSESRISQRQGWLNNDATRFLIFYQLRQTGIELYSLFTELEDMISRETSLDDFKRLTNRINEALTLYGAQIKSVNYEIDTFYGGNESVNKARSCRSIFQK